MKKLLAMPVLALLSLLIALPAHADVGPTPINAQGGIMKPSVSTNVSMDDEKVVLTYSAPKGVGANRVMNVHVTATFTMKNSGAAESMQVYFPTSDGDFVNGYSNKDITNFVVNGKTITTLSDVPAGFGKDGTTIKALQWIQNFPSGVTTLNISYDSQSSNQYGLFYLTYVLGTGRNWAGPIKSGEVDFVLPLKEIPEYVVSAKPPLLKASSLPYSISGNTIKITFSNYEPESDSALSISVGDIDTVKSIQDLLSNKTQTTNSYLNIANLFRQISFGPHCYICSEPEATQADQYYTLALDSATNEAELKNVLAAYAWGDKPKDVAQLLQLFKYFANHQVCSDNDDTCWSNQDSLQATPFLFGYNDKSIKHADFLARFACRERSYNKEDSQAVETYIGKSVASCEVGPKISAKTSTTPVAQLNIQWPIIAAILAGIAAVATLIVGIVLVNRHKKNTQALNGHNLKVGKNVHEKEADVDKDLSHNNGEKPSPTKEPIDKSKK